MKQIIPFQKELLFKTKVSEITSISLEHTLSLTDDDFISGEFHITGDYKMTEGSIHREKFDFKLPFDIALDDEYNKDNIVIDIDNFYYEVVNNESLKVNIDVYVEGEKRASIANEVSEQIDREDDSVNVIEESMEVDKEERIEVDDKENSNDIDNEKIEADIQYKKPDNYYLDDSKEENLDFNIFDQMDSSDTYVTYRVYIVKETDSIDDIIQKYGVSREEIALYNDMDDIRAGTKLIIPYCNE